MITREFLEERGTLDLIRHHLLVNINLIFSDNYWLFDQSGLQALTTVLEKSNSVQSLTMNTPSYNLYNAPSYNSGPNTYTNLSWPTPEDFENFFLVVCRKVSRLVIKSPYNIKHGFDAAHLVATALMRNGNTSKLEELQLLGHDNLKDVKYFSRALAKNQSLKKLEINGLDHPNYKSILRPYRFIKCLAEEGIGKNQSLINVSLQQNSISSLGAENCLLNAVKQNKSIVSLNLAGNDILPAILQEIARVLSANQNNNNNNNNIIILPQHSFQIEEAIQFPLKRPRDENGNFAEDSFKRFKEERRAQMLLKATELGKQRAEQLKEEDEDKINADVAFQSSLDAMINQYSQDVSTHESNPHVNHHSSEFREAEREYREEKIENGDWKLSHSVVSYKPKLRQDLQKAYEEGLRAILPNITLSKVPEDATRQPHDNLSKPFLGTFTSQPFNFHAKRMEQPPSFMLSSQSLSTSISTPISSTSTSSMPTSTSTLTSSTSKKQRLFGLTHNPTSYTTPTNKFRSVFTTQKTSQEPLSEEEMKILKIEYKKTIDDALKENPDTRGPLSIPLSKDVKAIKVRPKDLSRILAKDIYGKKIEFTLDVTKPSKTDFIIQLHNAHSLIGTTPRLSN